MDTSAPPPEDEGIGPLLRRLRTEVGWDQDTLARRAGMSRPYLSQIERSRDKWPATYVGALAAALGPRRQPSEPRP